MKKILPIFLLITFLACAFLPLASAQTPSGTVQMQTTLPTEDSWIIDPEVTKIGKNASRSGMFLDWTLKDYQWSHVREDVPNPLISFWLVIQRIVYAMFLVVILITAFILIITRGKSLSAKQFMPRFLLVIILVTFSFSLVQFIYQIVDIFQGFFLKNPQGAIIQSKDLLYIGWDYRNFVGLRQFGEANSESAFISLLLVKLTSFTYYVMSILLIVRKIILWFFIILSPIFPLLLLYHPIRNTAKIWLGEFFRWLLYAPLFAIFLAGLVRLWQTSLPLLFKPDASDSGEIIYPTAINILLGGPGQSVSIDNSVNLPDTFALYLVALIMLWVVIILPFILLQIFLDYMASANFRESPAIKQLIGRLNTRFSQAPSPAIPPGTPPSGSTGLARSLPFNRHFTVPQTIPQTISMGERQSVDTTTFRPVSAQIAKSSELFKLANVTMPTMRDIARFDSSRLTRDTHDKQEIVRMKQVLERIANPTKATISTERDHASMLKERLVTESHKGNQVATTLLQAAQTISSQRSSSTVENHLQNIQTVIEHLANPAQITSIVEREKVTTLREKVIHESQKGNQLATIILSAIKSQARTQTSSLEEGLKRLAKPDTISSSAQKQAFQQLRIKIVEASKSGNQLASLILSSLETAQTPQQVKIIQEKLLQAQAEGSSLAQEILKITEVTTEETETQQLEKVQSQIEEAKKQGDPLATVLLGMLATHATQNKAPVKATKGAQQSGFPVVNRLQQVSLDDYEAVKKLWKENYQNLDVPQSLAGAQSRKDWITGDIADIAQTISLLTSSNPQEVEEGMQKVSDILPFLLIGGFSQTEIVAYLKAKMEAGKAVLEDVNKLDSEEDQMVEVSHTTKAAPKQQYMTTTTEVDNSQDTEVNIPDNSSTMYQTQASTPVRTDTVQSQSPKTSLTPQVKQVLELAQLTIPTMRDIVSYEKNQSALKKVQSVLLQLARPQQPSYQAIKEALLQQSREGNPVAGTMLAAAAAIPSSDGAIATEEVSTFFEVLRSVVDPSESDPKEREAYQSLRELLGKARQDSSLLALSLLAFIDKLARSETEAIQRFLQKIAAPENIHTAPERTQYTKLRERLGEADDERNVVAQNILKAAKVDGVDAVEANKVRLQLHQADQVQDPLVAYILTTLIGTPEALTKEAQTLYSQLLQAKDAGDSLALGFLKLFAKKRQNFSHVSPVLPKENRVQQVGLEDYETVKQLWEENYLKAAVPQGKEGKEQTREVWIREDMASVTQTINLLASTNPEDVAEGMEQVSDILPFLLIGGFSHEEVLGYLKAKVEAGKNALAILQAQNRAEEEEVSSGKTYSQEKKEMATTITTEDISHETGKNNE